MIKGNFYKFYKCSGFSTYDYYFLGEHFELTVSETSLKKLIKYAIQEKVKRHSYLAIHRNRFLSKLWIKILSPIEFRLRNIIKE